MRPAAFARRSEESYFLSTFPTAPFAHVAAHMAGFERPWAICGGWAVDAWLGRHTRDHGDFDMFVFVEDERALFDHLSASWALIAHDEIEPDAVTAWDGRPLGHPAHIHAMPSMEVMLAEWVPNGSVGPMPLDDPSRFRLDIMFNERTADGLTLLAKPPAVSAGGEGLVVDDRPRLTWLPLDQAIRVNPLGLPSLAPEAIFYLKATAYWSSPNYQAKRPHDATDSAALLPLVPTRARAWLRESIAALYPEHPWLAWEGLGS